MLKCKCLTSEDNLSPSLSASALSGSFRAADGQDDHCGLIFQKGRPFFLGSRRLTFADAALCECAEALVLVCVEHSVEQSKLE